MGPNIKHTWIYESDEKRIEYTVKQWDISWPDLMEHFHNFVLAVGYRMRDEDWDDETKTTSSSTEELLSE